MVAVVAVIPVLFFIVSCQDQMETTTVVPDSGYPEKVQQAIDRLKANNPNADFIVVPPSGPNLKDFEGKHANHISEIDGEYVFEAISVLMIKVGEDARGNPLNYMILDYSSEKSNRLPTEDEWKTASKVWEAVPNKPMMAGDEPVFTEVENSAEPEDGFVAFNGRIQHNLKYPPAGRRAGLEGVVYIKIVVTKEGKLTDVAVVKGISKEFDLEALRLVKSGAQAWKPALQNGKPVNSQLVLPVVFKLNQ